MRAAAFVKSVLDPRAWLHLLRMVHFYNYSYVQPRRAATLGEGTALAPDVSFRNGERIKVGAHCQVNVGAALWAGNHTGRITIGDHAFIAPDVFITASNYAINGDSISEDSTIEQDVTIGANVWLGRGVTVLPGVAIGDGCVVGAGAVVTKTLPDRSIAVGVPAKVVGTR